MSATDVLFDFPILLATKSLDPDLRDRVGCTVYHGTKVMGLGVNKVPDGPMRVNGKAVPYVTHAETMAIQNAIGAFAGQFVPVLTKRDFKAYCTKEPCLHCLVQLTNAGVNEVHFIDAIPEEKSGSRYLSHFPNLKVYQHHADQLPKLLGALGIPPDGTASPAACACS
jgi:deoxycytidylate deaminase